MGFAAQHAHEDQRIDELVPRAQSADGSRRKWNKHQAKYSPAYLIRMRSSDQNHGTLAGDLPGTAGMDLSKEEVYQHGEGPEDQII